MTLPVRPLESSHSVNDEGRLIQESKFQIKLIPLTLLYNGAENRVIRLWETEKYGMIGSVVDIDGTLTIVNKNRIWSPLCPSVRGDELMYRVKRISPGGIDLIFNKRSLEIIIIPHLEAAGRLGVDGHKGHLTRRDLDAARRELTGEVVARKSDGTPFDHIQEVRHSQYGLLNIINRNNRLLSNQNLAPEVRERLTKELARASQLLDHSENFVPRSSTVPSSNTPEAKPPPNPAKEDFNRLVNAKGLAGTYNSSNKDNPIAKQGGGGVIGGVGCTVELIGGLFDSPESIFETQHSFFIPGEQEPFSHQEMCQILQELARGIYVHGTVPFFSLHFNEDSNLYPVIHPAYENTLVGQVISLLDYFMKGYLNGGIFKESFIRRWQQNPTKLKVTDDLIQELINLKTYAKAHLTGEDQNYRSVRELLTRDKFAAVVEKLERVAGEVAAIISDHQPEDSIFNDYTKFNNSFRIIAKQRGIHQAENLFLLDSDFDVEYTIEPNPDYAKALEEHYKLKGSYPKAYMNLLSACEKMKRQIHDHMVKMPFCRKYFAMLGVINFFSYYLMTLKKHGKMPILPWVDVQSAGCPSIFPPLPIFSTREESLKYNPAVIYQEVIRNNRIILINFLQNQATEQDLEKIRLDTIKEIWNDFYQNASKPMQREMQANRQDYEKLSEAFANRFNFLEEFQIAYSRSETLLKDTLGVDYYSSNVRIQAEMRDVFVDQMFLKCLNNEVQSLPPFPTSMFILPSEQNSEEKELVERVVGGCGMRVPPLKVQPSPAGHVILDNAWVEIQKTACGEWTPLLKDDPTIPTGFVFTLPFTDVPLNYTESGDIDLLLTSAGEDHVSSFGNMHKVTNSIYNGNQKRFTGLINKPGIKEMKDREKRSPLHHSASVENVFFTETLLEKDLSVTEEDEKKYLPIHYAAMGGHVPQLEILISKNSSTLHARSSQDATPLIVAIQHGKIDAVEYLISKGAEGDESLKDGYTALHCAVHRGDLKLVQTLLERSPKAQTTINKATQEGITPLMLVCRMGSQQLVEYLLKLGADPKLVAKNGTTALEIVVRKDHFEMCKLLAPRSMLTPVTIETAIKKSSLEINKLLASLPGYLNYQNAVKDTPLLMAIRYANVPVAMHILSLIPNAAPINVRNRIKESPVLLAAKGKFYSLLEELLKRGAQVDRISLFKLLLQTGYQGQNSFLIDFLNNRALSETELNDLASIAAKNGNHVAISKLLLPKGADLSKVRGLKGWRIDHYLAKSDGIYLFKMRYEQTNDLLMPLEDGKTLAYIAGENGSWRVLEFLLDQMKIKNVSLSNHYKGRHLFYSVLVGGDIKGIRLFVEKGMDPQLLNQPLDNAGTLPVHLAAKNCSKEVLEYLYKQGADFNAVDNHGRFPLYYAIQREKLDPISFLLDERHHNPITSDSIYLAASYDDDQIFKTLLASGANLDDHTNREQNTALLHSIQAHDSIAFFRLIQKDVSLVHSNRAGWTPLLLATFEGQLEMVETILNINPGTIVGRFQGSNALHIACERKHEHCARLLVDRGFSIEEKNKAGKNAIQLSDTWLSMRASLGINPHLQKYQGLSRTLHQAIMKQDLASILDSIKSWPVNSYFTINLRGRSFRGTLLHITLLQLGGCNGIERLIKAIMENKEFNKRLRDENGHSYAHLMILNEIDPTQFDLLDLEGVNNDGQTPLHYAANVENLHCLTKLIEKLGNRKVDPTDKNGRTPLFLAIQSNKLKHVKFLVKNGANLHHIDNNGVTPIIVACQTGNYPIIRTLVKAGANLNQRGSDGLTPLSISLLSKHQDIPLYLLFNGAKLDNVNLEGQLIGHIAALRGKIYVLRFLAEQGISLTSLNTQGAQPIHSAAAAGKIKILEFLASQGISLETPVLDTKSDSKQNKFSHATPIHLASMQGTREAVKWLLDNGANPEIKTHSGLNVLFSALNNTAVKSQELIHLFQDYLLTEDLKQVLPAINLAIVRDYVEPLELLYRMGIPISSKLEAGMTGLHIACQFGALNSTRFLLAHGAKWDALNDFGETPIELAAANKSPEQFQLMLNTVNPRLDSQNKKGETLMHLAARKDNLGHIMMLIDRGADFDIQNSQGLTPLHIAAENGSKEIIKLLLICGANANIKTHFNSLKPEEMGDLAIKELIGSLQRLKNQAPEESTPLHIAAMVGYPLAVRLALRHFEVDKKNSLGRTALHEATFSGSMESIRELLGVGANVDEPDLNGNTPLGIACLEVPNPRIMKFLLAAGAKPEAERNANRKARINAYIETNR